MLPSLLQKDLISLASTIGVRGPCGFDPAPVLPDPLPQLRRALSFADTCEEGV